MVLSGQGLYSSSSESALVTTPWPPTGWPGLACCLWAGWDRLVLLTLTPCDWALAQQPAGIFLSRSARVANHWEGVRRGCRWGKTGNLGVLSCSSLPFHTTGAGPLTQGCFVIVREKECSAPNNGQLQTQPVGRPTIVCLPPGLGAGPPVSGLISG